MATQNPAPKNEGLTQSIINEGKKVAQAGQVAPGDAVDQNAVKAQATGANQPNPGQPDPAPAQAFAQASHEPVPGAVNAAEFAEFQRWKQSQTQPPSSPAAQATAQPVDFEKQYGKNFVHASRGGVEQYFSAVTWRTLGGDQNKVGYKRVLSTPPEVANLKK